LLYIDLFSSEADFSVVLKCNMCFAQIVVGGYFPHYLTPCHHDMAHAWVVYGGEMASRYGDSCEHIE